MPVGKKVLRSHMGSSLWKSAATALVYKETIGGTTYIIAVDGTSHAVISWGIVDDIVINATMIYVNALGGGEIYVEQSVYTLTATVIMYALIALYGAGPATHLTGSGDFHLITINAQADCVVENLQLSGTSTGNDVDCINIEDGADRFRIFRVHITDSDRNGIYARVNTESLDVGFITECYITNTDSWGIDLASSDATVGYNYIHITNNHLTACGAGLGGGGIRTVRLSESEICENTVVLCTFGIYVDYSELIRDFFFVNVSDNICFSNALGGMGIYDSDYINITNNIIHSNGGEGIDVTNATYHKIEGNICYNNTSDGIDLSDAVGCWITDNHSTQNGAYGIRIDLLCDANRVLDNYLLGNTTGCILDGGTNTVTHQKTVYAPNQDAYVGATPSNHRGQQCLDNVPTQVPFEILIPNDFQELVTAHVIYVTAANGIINRSVATDFGKICAGEQIDTHSDAIAAADIAGNTTDEFECDDISAALTDIALGDSIGMTWTNFGAAAGTIDATVWVIEVRIRYV